MSTLVWLGAAVGLLVGVLHAVGVFRGRLAVENQGYLTAAYYGVWTIALWALFGPYVITFWMLGLAGLVLTGLWQHATAAK